MTRASRQYIPVLLLLGAYFVFGGILLYHAMWYVNSVDAFQYIRIAERYVVGDLSGAINATWSPLVSWALVPFLLVFQNGIVAFKVLQLIIGAGVVLVWYKALRPMDLGGKEVILWVLLPVAAIQGQLFLTPDLLFMGMVLWFLGRIWSGVGLKDRSNAVLLGVIGALMFLAKQFGLPLFIALLLAAVVQEWHTSVHKRVLLQHTALALATCLVCCAPWIIIISSHEGHATIGEAARYNLSIDPGAGAQRHPAFAHRLWEVPPGSVSVWEDPMRTLATNARPSDGGIGRVVERTWGNLKFLYYDQVRRQVGAVFFLLLGIAVVCGFGVRLWHDRVFRFGLVALLVLWLAYLPVGLQQRYVWAGVPIMLLLIARLLLLLLPQWTKVRYGLLLAVALLAVKRPIKRCFFPDDVDTTAMELATHLAHPFRSMKANFKFDRELVALAENLHMLAPRGRFASLHHGDGVRQTDAVTMQFVYLLDGTWHGNLDAASPLPEQRASLRSFQIEHLLVWNGAFGENDLVEGSANTIGLTLYRVGPSGPQSER